MHRGHEIDRPPAEDATFFFGAPHEPPMSSSPPQPLPKVERTPFRWPTGGRSCRELGTRTSRCTFADGRCIPFGSPMQPPLRGTHVPEKEGFRTCKTVAASSRICKTPGHSVSLGGFLKNSFSEYLKIRAGARIARMKLIILGTDFPKSVRKSLQLQYPLRVNPKFSTTWRTCPMITIDPRVDANGVLPAAIGSLMKTGCHRPMQDNMCTKETVF